MACWRWAKRHPFLCAHVAYFLLLSFVGALSLWAAPKRGAAAAGYDGQGLGFLDALFNAVSAITETGLASVPTHRFAISHQITLLLLMLLGGQVFTSAIPLFLRRLPFLPQPISQKCIPCSAPSAQAPHHNDGHGARCPVLPSSEDSAEAWAVLPPTTEEDTERKAAEYEALVIMSWLTALYLLLAILLGFLICQFCVIGSPHASAVLKQNHVSSSLFSIFATVSAFGNCGFTLLDDNMVPMQRSWVMLLCMSLLVLTGNTLYAPSLRFWVWVLHKWAKAGRKHVISRILDCRERQFTHIFPRTETAWLVGSVAFLNGCQMTCMLGIDWTSKAFKGLGPGYKLVDALFQSVSARFGGFNVVNLSGFSSPTLFVSLVAMYIAAYPILRTNHLQQKHESNIFVEQLSKIRKKDSFLIVAIFLICLIERESMRNDPLNFSFFNIVFEVVSAYGNVGLTLGYNCSFKMMLTNADCNDLPCAFSGYWSSSGKVVLIVVMLLGRNQNILDDIDWDIRLPMDKLS